MLKKKIAFVVAIPLTAKAFLMNHFDHLQEKYEIHLIANFGSEETVPFQSRSIVCHNVPIKRSIHILFDCYALCLLINLLLNEKFDSVHSVTPKAGLLAACAGWVTRVPHRIHIFTGQVWATRKGVMRWLLKKIDRLIAVLDTDLLVDGESQRQFLIKEGVLNEQNSFVPANGSIAGVKLEQYVISSEIRKEVRDSLGISEDRIVYIFLGRLNHDKGIYELFAAFNKLVKECPKSVLLLFGFDEEGCDGEITLYPNIKRGVNYFFPGRTSTPYKSLQAGDVFVLPTWREGFGVSVLEAQSVGLPAITTDVYGVLDAIDAGITGLRCHVGDVDGLYKCMKTYYDDSKLRIEHGNAGRKRVEEKFNNEIVSQAWLDFYNKLFE